MSGALQVVFQNQRSFIPPLPAIGDAYQGGFFAGQIGVSGVATHNLVVAPASTGEFRGAFKNLNNTAAGADSVIDGPQNTADMVADGNSTVYPCAHFCNNLVIGSYSDWYMPAKNELEVCFFNLKPTQQDNFTGAGINPNSVPERTSNYTNGPRVPDQTSATNFRTTGSEDYELNYYWTSTEHNYSNGKIQAMYNGNQTFTSKNNTNYKVRAIRRVAV